MYFPKTGTLIDSRLKSINHAKKYYDSIECAFLDVHNTNKPKCKYCNNVSKFLGLFQGYHNTCYSKECLRLQVVEVNQKISYDRIKNKNLIKNTGYIDFIKNNINFYKSVQCPFLDPYLNVIIKDTRRYFNKRDINDTLFCPVTKKYYEYNYFYSDDITRLVSYSKSNANIRKYLSYDEIKFILDNRSNFNLIKDVYQKNKKTEHLIRHVCSDLITFNLRIKVPKKNDDLEVIYKDKIYVFKNPGSHKTNFNMNEVLSESELLEVLGHEFVCISCKNKFYKKQLVYNILKCEFYFKDIKLPKYSCGKRESYDFILKNHKIELYPITEVQKIKQSNTMKKMIYDGVFYPVNNRKHHNKYEIDGFKLKSTWEVIFYCHLKYNDKTVEYESVVIKYNDNRNYFVDFYLPNDNILYEVKPTCELINDTIISKHEAAENYAKVNNILFNVITEYDIFKIIKNNNFLYDYIESQDLSYKDKVLKSYKNFMKEA